MPKKNIQCHGNRMVRFPKESALPWKSAIQPLCHFSLFLWILIFNSRNASSQQVHTYNSPGSDCYCAMTYGDQPNNPKGLLVIETNSEDVETYSRENFLLESGRFDDYLILYVEIKRLGAVSSKSCLEHVTKLYSGIKRINPEVIFILKEWIPSHVVLQSVSTKGPKYATILYTKSGTEELRQNLDELVFSKPFKIKNDFTHEEVLYQEKMSNYAKNSDLSLFLFPSVLTGQRLGLDRGAITSYGISFSKNFKANQSARFTIGTSLKIPNQSAVQSSIQSDVQSAVFAGEDSLNINQEIAGHIVLFTQLDYKYFLTKDERFRWFVGAGAGFTNVTSIRGNIDDTIDLTSIDLNDPSSFQDAFDQDDISPELDQTNENYLTGQLEFGLEYRITPGAKFHASIPVKNYFDRNLNSTGSSSFGLNFGLSFTVNPGKLGKGSFSELHD